MPGPNVRVAFAAIEKSDRFVSSWGHWSRRLGAERTSEHSVLADGAPWIWEGASMHFAGHDGVLDIYHALEHVAEATRELFDKGTEPNSAKKQSRTQTPFSLSERLSIRYTISMAEL